MARKHGLFLLAVALLATPASAQRSTSRSTPSSDTSISHLSDEPFGPLSLADAEAWESTSVDDFDATCCRESSGPFDEMSFFLGIDGSKQPQDFGVNAHVGGQASVNWGIPLLRKYGVGAQVGTGITSTANAVRVYELLGETTGRTQSYTTLGLFQRTDNGFSWGFVHDFLSEDYFDDFSLGQWRVRGAYALTPSNEVGITTMLRSYSDSGAFGAATQVTLKPITQGHVYWRHFWKTGAQTTCWVGLAEGHGEDNAVTGFSPAKDEQVLVGADVLMPLSDSFAIYGETNMIMPSDTGTVDAFLGVQWCPGRNAFRARRGQFSPLLRLASPVSFAVDLSR